MPKYKVWITQCARVTVEAQDIIDAGRKALKDLNGRTYTKLSDLKPGDKLEADNGFDCIDKDIVYIVKKRRKLPSWETETG